MKAFFVSLILTAAPISLVADQANPDFIASIESGVLCLPEPAGFAPAPNTLTGSTKIITEEPEFTSTDNQVPAVLGIGFGVKSLALRPGGIEGVVIFVTHPPMGDTQTQLQSFTTWINDSDPSLTFFHFDHSYELVQGTWNFTAMLGEEVLFSVPFEVVDPKRLPGLAESCGYRELLS